jgi:DNA-binding transcriptional ArsR family regulator
MPASARLLAVLADPTRRALVERLRERPAAVGDLARCVTVSRSAVSQHLQVLREAELVDERRVGSRRIYRLRPEALGELRGYVDSLWGDALLAFGKDSSQ